MVEPAKNSIWIYLIPLWQLEQVSSTFGRRGVEVSLTSHYNRKEDVFQCDGPFTHGFSVLKYTFMEICDYERTHK